MQHFHRTRTIHLSLATCLTFALLAVSGCGGKGAGGQTVSVSASPKSVVYGQSTRVSWSASATSRFSSSSFGLTEDNFREGSINDTPGTTTTYELRVNSEEGNTVPARATVTVAPIAEDVLVVGDAGQAGPEQIASFIGALTTGTVTVAASVPAPSETYGLLVMSPTTAASSVAASRIKAWLDAGKGVMLCGKSPQVLATGNRNNDDVSAIGSWFFGVNEMGRYQVPGFARTSSTGLVRLSAAVRGQSDENEDTETALPSYGPQVDVIDGYQDVLGGLHIYIAAYSVPTGGRLVFSGSPVGYGDSGAGVYRQAFESALRWAGQNPD